MNTNTNKPVTRSLRQASCVVHYVNLGLYGDGKLDAATPEALIHEPSGDRLRLVGVEYLVDAATWLAAHNNTPPVLEGQVLNLVGAAEPIQPAGVFRATPLGVARESAKPIRGLEQPRVMRRSARSGRASRSGR